MKKNYTLLYLLLVLSNFYNWASYGQTPIAVNDEFNIFPPFCTPPPPLQVMSNDILFGPQESYTIDLDPAQPGIQSITISQGGGFFEVQGSMIFYNNQSGINLPGTFLNYTIQDNLGNISNVATINIFTFSFTPIFSATPTSCEVNNGAIVISSFFDTTTIDIQKDGVFFGTYNALPGDPDLVISGLSAGEYSILFTQPCTAPEFTIITLRILNPITASLTPTYVDYNNDGITNVGDIVNYQVNATNTSASCTMNDVGIYNIADPNSGGTYINGPIATFAPSATDNSSLNFYRTLKQIDINNGYLQRFDFISVSNPQFESSTQMNTNVPLNITDGIKLNAFIDSNNNGMQDGSEPDYTQGTFGYQINGENIHNINSSTGEHYLYETNPANVYTLSYNINPINNYCGTQYLIATPSYSNVTVANGSGVTTYNFAITVIPCHDVSVYIYGGSNPRPGFTSTNYITYVNEGNQTVSGSITFTNDSVLTLISNSVSAPMTATGFTYNYTNLNPGESRTITALMQVPVIPTVSLGQWVTNSVSVTPTDGNPTNNTATLTQTIVGSYDPNDKTESHGGKIVHSGFTADDYLTYTIRFENTGTAEAINIRVNDVLDAQLDETSIKMVKASHAYVLDRVGSNLTWRFDGVNLPPSVPNDEITGHGYIVFQVKPKPGFALGDIIPNTADIYFDFNPAIVTNTCITEFVPFLGVNAFDASNFEFYPNPTSGIVTFAMKNSVTIDTIEVVDVLGKSLISKTVRFNNAEIDFSSLKQGIYLVKLKANGQTKTVKITKS